MAGMTSIVRATAADTNAILKLLEDVGLPQEGLRGHLATTLVAKRDGELIGSAALEMYTNGALLRSVAIDRSSQGLGLGKRLTEAAIEMARSHRVGVLYLLTTTAEKFFPRFGFEPITRDDVPSDVRQSMEFTSACPSTAAVMRKILPL